MFGFKFIKITKIFSFLYLFYSILLKILFGELIKNLFILSISLFIHLLNYLFNQINGFYDNEFEEKFH